MNSHDIMIKIESLMDDARTAVLATADQQGRPFVRWMTPVILKGRPDTLFTFSRPDANKIKHIKSQAEVEWMFQDRGLNEIIHARGTVTLIDHPGLKSEILENVGSRLTAFWKIDLDNTDIIVLETTIKEAVYYQPMEASYEIVKF